VIALVGAVTGIVGLCWQVVSFTLAGARVKVKAQCYQADEEGEWWGIGIAVSNRGRLDAYVIGLPPVPYRP
jgi:hypothetical protein